MMLLRVMRIVRFAHDVSSGVGTPVETTDGFVGEDTTHYVVMSSTEGVTLAGRPMAQRPMSSFGTRIPTSCR